MTPGVGRAAWFFPVARFWKCLPAYLQRPNCHKWQEFAAVCDDGGVIAAPATSLAAGCGLVQCFVAARQCHSLPPRVSKLGPLQPSFGGRAPENGWQSRLANLQRAPSRQLHDDGGRQAGLHLMMVAQSLGCPASAHVFVHTSTSTPALQLPHICVDRYV